MLLLPPFTHWAFPRAREGGWGWGWARGRGAATDSAAPLGAVGSCRIVLVKPSIPYRALTRAFSRLFYCLCTLHFMSSLWNNSTIMLQPLTKADWTEQWCCACLGAPRHLIWELKKKKATHHGKSTYSTLKASPLHPLFFLLLFNYWLQCHANQVWHKPFPWSTTLSCLSPPQ